MRYIEVSNTTKLEGSVKIQGSKNSSLGLIAAACLSDEIVTINNIPNISDVHIFIDILKDIGAEVSFIDNNRIIINPKNITEPIISSINTSKVRPAYYFIGSLLAKHKKIKIGYPGGDKIGKRPIDQHIKGFKLLGADVELLDDSYIVSAEKLTGCNISFDTITAGATLNIMMAAVFAEGTTRLFNAARDPEIVDAAILLTKMGAKIHGAGTSSIRIDGVQTLSGCTHSVIPDRLIAGTYLMAVGITSGCVTVTDVIPEHIMPLAYKLEELGIDISVEESSITAKSDGNLNNSKIIAEKFPIFETDFQQPISVLLIKAKGASTVMDKTYPDRSNHCSQLSKMGAKIKWKNGTAFITGGKNLKGTKIHVEDIRAGTSLVLAGLLAKGKTQVYGVEHLERGFVDIIQDLSLLGANIKLVEE